MKFSVLSARIDRRRKLTQEPLVVQSTHEAWADVCFDARDISLVTESDHFVRQLSRVAFPNWKKAVHSSFRQVGFAPRSQILQEQITKCHALHASGFVTGHRPPHDLFVNIIGASSPLAGW